MSCEIKKREEVLDKYLNDQMSADEKAGFERHLFDCDDCFHEVNLHKMTSQIIREEGNEIFAGYLKEKELTINKPAAAWSLRNRWVSIPAAAVILLVAGFLILNHQEKKSDPKNMVLNIFRKQPAGDKENIKKPGKEAVKDAKTNTEVKITKTDDSGSQLMAANFTESPNFENLIAQESRSDFTIEVNSPSLNATFSKAEISFKWKSGIKDNVFLEIFTNKERKLFISKTTNNELSLNIELREGLYYWKLVSDDNLLYIGKFRIKK